MRGPERETLPRVRNRSTYGLALCSAMTALSACTAQLPTVEGTPASTPSLLLSGANSNVVSGRPRAIYERVARQASRCWFGPFGSVHDRYIMHADVPPPSSTAPVTMAIHRRLNNRKKPWGPALFRAELKGKSTTTLTYRNLGLAARTMTRMSDGFTRWANGRTNCGPLHEAEPQWAPLATSAPRRRTPGN